MVLIDTSLSILGTSNEQAKNWIFILGGYFSHPIDYKICNIKQAFTLQSMAILRGSFLHFGGKIARSPCVIISLVMNRLSYIVAYL